MPDDLEQRTALGPDEHVLGRADAPIVVLEYGDFECPHCAAARPALEELVEENPDLVRFVFRHFPVTTTHPRAMAAAEAAEAAGAQGKFWEMHDLIFGDQEHLEDDDLEARARALGLDIQRFRSEMASHAHLARVKADFKHGVTDGVNGTPTIFIDRHRYDGPREPALLFGAVRKARMAPSTGPSAS